MASATVTRPDVFPNGTSVAAYPVANQSEHGRAGGTADDTKTVSSDSAAFTTLTAGRSYVLVGDNGKTLRMRTVETSTGIAGVPLPSWRQRRRNLGLI